jgi:chloramphenicol O-acetyltransferase type A
MKIIDKENWERKEHFEFFSAFDEPFFGLVAQVEVSKAYRISKSENKSFFALYLYAALTAANSIEAFRMRLVEDQIVLFDEIHASPTLGRKNNTFGFSFIPYTQDFGIFQKQLNEANQVGAANYGTLFKRQCLQKRRHSFFFHTLGEFYRNHTCTTF